MTAKKRSKKPKLPLSDLKKIVKGPETFAVPMKYREEILTGLLNSFYAKLRAEVEEVDYYDDDDALITIKQCEEILSEIRAFIKMYKLDDDLDGNDAYGFL